MSAFLAELVKLKRSLSWSVVLVLPVLIVLSGAVSTIAAGAPPEDGWHTMWLRSVVFYGLFPLPIGIGILASLVWRAEHRGGNWNALMSGTTSTFALIAAKAAVVVLLSTAMQLVLLVSITAVGNLALGLEGVLPANYWGLGLLIAVACVPVAAAQSLLSVLMRSFAAPIAVAFAGSGLAVVLLMAEVTPVLFLLPYAVVVRTTQLGTGTFADTGTITAGIVVVLTVAASVLTTAILVGTAALVDRRDLSA